MKIFEPLEIYVDPEATCLEQKWWHKFMFWKKFIYPRWVIPVKKVSIKDL